MSLFRLDIIESLLRQIIRQNAADAVSTAAIATQIASFQATEDKALAKLTDLVSALEEPSGPETGSFGIPQLYEEGKPIMSALALLTGQNAVSKLVFMEAGAAAPPPADGAVSSSDPSIATISLGADFATWTATGVAVGTATMTYTGTGPDGGPCVVPPMDVTVAAQILPETGDFDPADAVFSSAGP